MQQESNLSPALPAAGPREFAHRLNNLLTVVLAHAEAALSSEDPEEMKRALQIIVQSSTSMADVVRNFAKSPGRADSSARSMQGIEGS